MRAWIAGLVFVALPLSAQSAADAFRASVQDKTLFFRDFSGDPVVRWKWAGGSLVQEKASFRELSAILVQKVKVKSDSIILTGKRIVFVPDSGAKPHLLNTTMDVSAEFNLRGADQTTLLPQLADLAFYPSLIAATAALPCAQYRAITGQMPAGSVPGGPRCAGPSEKPERKPRYTPPRPVFTPEPVFTEAARLAKFSGNVMVGLTVNENGLPENLWVIRPVGLGLDFAAADTVMRYRFHPALSDGIPTAVDMYIDVNFQIF